MDPKLKHILKRGVAEIIVEEEMLRLLESGKPLRLKQGFDPSRPDIHLGHVVGLRKLRQFQELGHRVILIVGDWTAQIGDPSGESATRPMLSAEEVRANAETYMQQFFKVVDRAQTEVKWQSEWFGKFGLADVIRLTSKFTVAQFLARDDFAQRYAAGRPIAITEMLYPLLQAYDSVMIQADVEFGGTDQKFNCLVGRELQGMVGQRPQQVFLMPLLVGTDGARKMSKSLGNYIAVTEPPHDMYGKVMSIPDRVMMDYFELLTDVTDRELEEFKEQLAAGDLNPMNLKKRLAGEIVTQFHGAEAARNAETYFERVVQQKEAPEGIRERHVSFEKLVGDALRRDGWQIIYEPKIGSRRPDIVAKRGDETMVVEVKVRGDDLLIALGLVDSRSEAKRLIREGAVEVDGKRVTNDQIHVDDGSIIKVGKRRWVKIVNSDKQG